MSILRPIACSLILSLSASAAYADFDALVQDCNDCHGPDGVSAHSDVPTIAGQS